MAVRCIQDNLHYAKDASTVMANKVAEEDGIFPAIFQKGGGARGPH